MDEFPSLGKMDSLSQGITTLRSYGGRMMIVAQSISNLKGAYGNDGAQNFLANCRLQLFMAPADAETPDYVSKAIGDFTRRSRSKSWQVNSFGSGNIQEREEGARLIRPEDLRSLSDEEVVLLVQGHNPVKARKVRYYEDRALRPLYEGQIGELPEPPAIEPIIGTKAEALISPVETPVLTTDKTESESSVQEQGPKRLREASVSISDLPEKEAVRIKSLQQLLMQKATDVRDQLGTQA